MIWSALGRVGRFLQAQWGRFRRQFIAVTLASLLVVTTAVVGLVVEDWLPNASDKPLFDTLNSTHYRVRLAFGLILAVVAFTAIAAVLRRSNGTLYYVRILDERAPDLHAAANGHAQQRALDYRSVVHSLDLGTERSVDVASFVAQARAQLQIAGITDDTSSSFEVAPNSHWPIAFALGYDWPLPENAKLIEFNGDNPVPGFTVSAQPIDHSVPRSPTTRDSRVQLVRIDFHLTIGRLVTENDRRAADQEVFGRAADISMAYGRSGICTDPDGRPGVRVGRKSWRHRSADMTPEDAARMVALAILRALEQYPNAVVAVSASVPKVVGVLAGRQFAAYLQLRNSGVQSRNWISPWRRLSLLSPSTTNHDAGASGSVQIMRVHPSQPATPPYWPPVPVAGTIVNLLPHDLRVFDGESIVLQADRSSTPARIGETRGTPHQVSLNGITTPVVDLSYADTVTGLPEPVDGTWYVVSRITAQALQHRFDLLFPVDEVRNDQAQIIGCRSLGRFVNQAEV